MTYSPQPGQPNPYGHPGYPSGQPPKGKQGVIIAIIVIAVLVLGGGGVTLWLLNKDDGASEQTFQPPGPKTEDSPTDNPASEDSPTEGPTDREAEAAVTAVAQQYADAINNEDEAAATQLMCDKTEPGTLYTTVVGQIKVDIGKAEVAADDSATVDFTVRGAGNDPTMMFFELRNGAWCVLY